MWTQLSATTIPARMKIEKYHLSLAGEYRVCAELLKRGIFATVTFGNMKGADVVAVGSNRRAAVIETKASNGSRFVTGFYRKYTTPAMEHPTFWVLYSATPVDRFFVLSHDELAAIQADRNHPGETLPYEERVRRVARGVDNVAIANVRAHEDAWQKIVEWCSATESERAPYRPMSRRASAK